MDEQVDEQGEDREQRDRDETGNDGGDLRRPLWQRVSIEAFPGAAEGGLRFHGRPRVRQPRPRRGERSGRTDGLSHTPDLNKTGGHGTTVLPAVAAPP